MPPKKYFNCKACKSKHIKPIDELCPFSSQTQQERQGPAQNEPVSHQQTDNSDSDTDIDIGTQILTEMKNFGTRLSNIETKVADNQTSIQSLSAAAAPSQASVIPSLPHLQQSPVIQRGVDERMHHLSAPTDCLGKYKS